MAIYLSLLPHHNYPQSTISGFLENF